MPRAELSVDDAIRLATKRVLPDGFKPEDYLIVNDSIPNKIAMLIVREAQHLINMDRRWK